MFEKTSREKHSIRYNDMLMPPPRKNALIDMKTRRGNEDETIEAWRHTLQDAPRLMRT